MLGRRVIVCFAMLFLCVEGIARHDVSAAAGYGSRTPAGERTLSPRVEGAEDAAAQSSDSSLQARRVGQKTHDHIVVAALQTDAALPAATSAAALRVAPSLQHAFESGEMSVKLLWAYVAAFVVMVLVVSIMFFPMGRTVIFQVVLYIACLAFVKISMKAVYKFDFNFPKFITSLHLLVSSLAAFSVLLYRSYSEKKEIAIPSPSEFAWRLMPISLTFGLSIGAENSALVFVSAAFSEVVASSNPVMSAALTCACGMPFQMLLLAPIAMVVAGCVVSVSGELFFSSFGLFLLLFSVFCRSLKAVMQQQLMSGETKEKFDPVTLMAWTCLLSCGQMVMYSLATEGRAPVEALKNCPNQHGLVAAIVCSCVVACTLNIAALFVIRQLGAVGMQMVSQMKAILVVIGGMALLNESFTTVQQIGFLMVLSGVYWYSRWKLLLDPNATKGH